MSKQLQKSLHECLSKIKISNKQIQHQLHLRGRKKTKTPSFALNYKEKQNDAVKQDNPPQNDAAAAHEALNAVTLSDIDKFLFENFRSLYQNEFEEEASKKKTDSKTAATAAAIQFESSRILDRPPPRNFARSDRFFISTGSSASIFADEAASSSSTSATADSSTSSGDSPEKIPVTAAPEDFIALLTYSPSPYEDFRRSMQEMVDARMEHNGKVDWGFLEELLFCYLDLNNKKSYGFILRAFVDLIVVLRESSGKAPAIRHPWNGGNRRRQIK